MFEKKLAAVPPQLFVSDGGANGVITIADACKYRVKQQVIIEASTLQNLSEIEVKRVLSNTQLIIGPKGGSINKTIDLSLYTTALGAFIYANEQQRPSIPFEEFTRAVYEEEPVVATRVFNVDHCGKPYSTSNPFPVQLSDGSINIGSVNAELEVQLSHKDDDPDAGDVHDSVRIGDGEHQLEINPDGSINVVTPGDTPATTPLIQNISVTLANTEYSATIPINTKRFLIRARSGDPKLQVSYTLDNTGTTYITVRAGSWYSESGIKALAAMPIYFRSNKPNEVIELLSWV